MLNVVFWKTAANAALATGMDDCITSIDTLTNENPHRQAQRSRRELPQRDSAPRYTKEAPSPESVKQYTAKTRASCDPAQTATMPRDIFAPLAQLAEQLTLNQ